MGHVAGDRPESGEARVDARAAHGADGFVTGCGQRRNDVRADEAVGAGNQYAHGVSSVPPVGAGVIGTQQYRSARRSVASTNWSTIAGSVALWPASTTCRWASGQAWLRSYALAIGQMMS